MIFLKYTGIILIALSSMLTGLKKSYDIRFCYKTKCELLTLMKHIEQGIKYGGRPLHEIISSLDRKILSAEKSDISNEIKSMIENLRCFEKSDRELLIYFFENLGKSAICEKELSLCSECISQFEESVRNSEKNELKKADLFTRLGMIASALSIILLI